MTKPLRNKKSGVALIMVMISLAFIAIVIVEIMASSRVDIRIAQNARNRLQSHYLAMSGARLALLRLKIYIEVKNLEEQGGALPTNMKDWVDKIWSLPLPPFPFEGSKLNWPGQFTMQITSEGSKIPVNLLDANVQRNSSKLIADNIKDQLTKLVDGLLQTEEWDEEYRGLEAKDLVNPLVDWIDPDDRSQESGDEANDYERMNPPYKPRNDRLLSLTELHLIKGWTDDLYNRLSPSLSIINQRAEINPNYISLLRIRAWGPLLTMEELAVIEKRRFTQPFGKLEDLETFVRTSPEIKNGYNFEIPKEIRDKNATREVAFAVESRGIIGTTHRGIRMGVLIKEEYKQPNTDTTTLDDNGNPVTDPNKKPEKPGKLIAPQVLFVEEIN